MMSESGTVLKRMEKTRIGLVTTPLVTGHAVRGVGFYTKRLYESLIALVKEKEYRGFEVVAVSGDDLLKVEDLRLSVLHYPFFDVFYPTLKTFKRLPTAVTVHDVIPLRFPEHYPAGIIGKLNVYLQKKTLQSVKAVITDSATSKRDIVHYLGVPENKVYVVSLAPQFILRSSIPKIRKEEVKKRYKLPDKFILYVGDVNWNKNVLSLIQACEKIKVPLVIIGRQAAEIDSLNAGQPNIFKPRDLIRNILGIPHPQLLHLLELKRLLSKNSVIRLGFVPEPDLPVIYSLASVYCQPSFWEGFGLNPLEAITVGCPVVSSDTPALRELLGESAMYVNPEDYLSIASGISGVLNDSGVRERLVMAGKIRSKNYSWDKTSVEMLKIYSKILNK